MAFGQPLQGMKRASNGMAETAKGIAGGDVTSARMVELIEGERMFEANASVVREQSKMVGSLLNVKR